MLCAASDGGRHVGLQEVQSMQPSPAPHAKSLHPSLTWVVSSLVFFPLWQAKCSILCVLIANCDF